MSQYVVHELGGAGRAYLVDVLAKDGLTLAKRVASALQGRAGRVYTYMPVDVSRAELRQFQAGGKAAMCDTLPWYAELVSAYLRRDCNRLCVLEDVCSRPGSPWLGHARGGHIVTYHDEVYRVLVNADADAKVAEGAIRDAASASIASAFMTSGTSGWDPATPTLSQPDLAHLAQNVCKVAVGAYDLEGWIIWEAEE